MFQTPNQKFENLNHDMLELNPLTHTWVLSSCILTASCIINPLTLTKLDLSSQDTKLWCHNPKTQILHSVCIDQDHQYDFLWTAFHQILDETQYFTDRFPINICYHVNIDIQGKLHPNKDDPKDVSKESENEEKVGKKIDWSVEIQVLPWIRLWLRLWVWAAHIHHTEPQAKAREHG